MRNLMTTVVLAASVLAFAAPEMATARVHHTNYASSRHAQSCHNARRRRGNTGTVVGGVGGALAGHALGHGSLGGTLLGGAVGAVAGHAIADRRKGDC